MTRIESVFDVKDNSDKEWLIVCSDSFYEYFAFSVIISLHI